jgi:hypothetical protein
VALEVNDVHTLIELVGHGLGVAVVPRPVALKPQAAGLRTAELVGSDVCPWEVSVAVPDGRRTSPAARELLSYLPGTAVGAVDTDAFPGPETRPDTGPAVRTGPGSATGPAVVTRVPAPRG